jgi:hypothetical protein
MTIEESDIVENVEVNPKKNTLTRTKSTLTRTKSWFHKMMDNITSYFNDNNNILHVISVISNPVNYKRRYELMTQFIDQMTYNGGLNNSYPKRDTNIKLYIVELAYGDQEFVITESDNPNHLQLRCEYPLWHKENMINIGVQKLLPKNWKYMAWIDADIEFDSCHWSFDTINLLKNNYDIVQLFSVALDLNEDNVAMNIFQSYGYKYVEGYANENKKGINYWHPGYAWAIRRDAYDKIGKLYDLDIVGSGDYRMAKAIVGELCFYKGVTDGTKNNFIEWVQNANGLLLGYVPGVIRHYYHGDKADRKYVERNDILINHNYDATIHIEYNEDGIIVPTELCPKSLLDDIYNYFSQRNEDSIYNKKSELQV